MMCIYLINFLYSMFKLENIKKDISANIDLNSEKWVVFSWIDKNDNVLFIKWFIFTDKLLWENISDLYSQFVLPNKKLSTLVIDVIDKISEIKTKDDLQNIDLLKEWVFIQDIKDKKIGSFILPNSEISSLKKAMDTIKTNTKFTQKQVNIYKFSTQRFTFYKN